MRKEYSKEALSIRAVLKALKGVSRYVGALDCSATWEGSAEEEARLSISMRRPSERASWAGRELLEAAPGMTDQ